MKYTIYAEDGEDFQEYVYADTGKRVQPGKPIGYEENNELFLYENIKYSDTPGK